MLRAMSSAFVGLALMVSGRHVWNFSSLISPPRILKD